MVTKLTFHEIHSLGSSIHAERVTTPLPFEIMKGVTVEDVSSWLTDETLDWVSRYIGIYQTEALKNVRFALVHSYVAGSSVRGTDEEMESEKLVRNLVELMHIIRPMRQNTSIVRGNVAKIRALEWFIWTHRTKWKCLRCRSYTICATKTYIS